MTEGRPRAALSVPAGTDLFLRMKAELRRSGSPSWLVSVRDNTAGDALYAVLLYLALQNAERGWKSAPKGWRLARLQLVAYFGEERVLAQ